MAKKPDIAIDISSKPAKGIKEIQILDKFPSSEGLTYTVILVDIDGQLWSGKILLRDESVEWKALTNITPKL